MFKYVIIFIFKESAVNTCTAPGYTDDPVMGCYRLYTNIGPLTKEEAVKQCAGDGGRLVLIKSETEAKAFQKLLGMYQFIFGAMYIYLSLRRACVRACDTYI